MKSDVVLVTGASGFVGQALVQKLLADDCTVVALTRDRTRPLLGSVTIYGDVTDGDLCRRVLADYQIRRIYHLAAQSIVSICAEDPVTTLHVNVMGTARLLDAVRETKRPIKTLVMTSDKVYGSAPSPYDEQTPLDARHSYEVSKACQDLVARMYASNYGLDVRVVRCVNIYGPGDPNTSRLIPNTVRRCLQGESPVVHAGAADMKRQYIYIDDAVAALQTVMDRGAAGEAYCVGSPDPPLSVREVVNEIMRQMNTTTRATFELDRVEVFKEIQEQSVNDAKLRELGWHSKTTFRQGIEWILRLEGVGHEA